MRFIIVILVLLVVAVTVAVSMSAHADALQAQAAIEAARAAQIAVSGQAINATLLTVLVVAFGLSFLVSLILIGYLLYQRNKPQSQSKWLPGPNARWGRVGDFPHPVALPQGDPIQQLVQLELLRYLRQMNTTALPSQNVPQKPAGDDDDEPLW